MADIVNSTNQVIKDVQASMKLDAVQDAIMDMQGLQQQQQEMNGLFKQYQVDDDTEIDNIYQKYAGASFQVQTNQKFVPLQQQKQSQQEAP